MWLVIPFLVALAFWLATWLGAPYLPTRRKQIRTALKLLDLKSGQTVIDLGSGDGSFLLTAAKQGVKGIGYEINPLLWAISKARTLKYRRLVKIHLSNYWQAGLPPADAIYVFLISRYMSKLDVKLQAEIKRPTKVASYSFEIPGRKPLKKSDGVWLYQYP
jgi:hypothetical protein